MGKVKIKKKNVFIDMTAMSDVTVLLLTFFMLTSTFLQKEPTTVITPSSVSEQKVPVTNLATVLVSPKGQVFISILGDADSTFSSEKMRAELLLNVAAEYNKTHKSNPVQFNKRQVETFSKINMFGYPLRHLAEFLDKPQVEQDELIDPSNNPNAGIPIDDNTDLDHPNEFQLWMRGLYSLNNDNFENTIKDGSGIALKADQATPYEIVSVVMDNLQTLKMNKFSFMTALKSEGE